MAGNLKLPSPLDARLFGESLRFETWYDRSSGDMTPTNQVILKDYLKGRHYLSVKQVSTCLAVKSPGNYSIREGFGALRRTGFPIRVRGRDDLEEVIFPKVGRQRTSDSVSSLSSVLSDDASSQMGDVDSFSVNESVEDEGLAKGRHASIMYSDPWKTMAGYMYYEATGKPGGPELRVWHGDQVRLHDPLPVHILGKHWTGSKKGKVRFQQIASFQTKVSVLMNRTFWGCKLQALCNEKEPFAITLRKRISYFLEGKHDPLWNKRKVRSLYGEWDYPIHNTKGRSVRFIEMLKTVDGVFAQRFLCFPEEKWTWSKYDMFILFMISSLIGDEFIDGVINDNAIEYTTHYEELKKARKLFKMISHNGSLQEKVRSGDLKSELPRWLHFYLPLWECISQLTGHKYIYAIGVMSQTRGAGTPPPLVVQQSKMKFLTTITTPEKALNPTAEGILMSCLDTITKRIPDEAFTGLSTKARVTVTPSACWEYSRREGGTVQAIQDLVWKGQHGITVPITDLNTGEAVSRKSMTEMTTGEYIFWGCLRYVLQMKPSDLIRAQMVTVKEPGKARTVTKATAYLKIVLDVVSKVCAHPLKKGVKSSTSGMGKSAHGWNLFKDLYNEDFREDLFRINEVNEEQVDENVRIRTETYERVYMSSTDYTTATDFMNHRVARKIGRMWMNKCGIPPLLQGIVMSTCFVPRKIYFVAIGSTERFGQPTSLREGVRMVKMVRGVLMGDPLTKVILHLLNIAVRVAAGNLDNPDFLSSSFKNAMQLSKAHKKRDTN